MTHTLRVFSGLTFLHIPVTMSTSRGGKYARALEGKMAKKVLLIDGDRYLLALTRVSLELDGFQVITANSQEQGLQLWEDENPDMIILDAKINEDGNVTLCRQIRECTDGSKPVIVLSAHVSNAGGGNSSLPPKMFAIPFK